MVLFYHLYSLVHFIKYGQANIVFIVFFIFAQGVLFSAKKPVSQKNYSQLGNAQQFIDNFASRHSIEKTAIVDIFKRVAINEEKKEKIIDLAAKPLEKTASWENYKKIFINKTRISLGKVFYKENRDTLVASYKKYGVNTKIIVATLGIETLYGRNTGRHEVLQSLMVQSFLSKKRETFFKKQLESFLLLHFRHDFPIFKTLGSYSGALGPAQFMPTSIYYYAVDVNRDGKKNMLSNYEDIIFSIANYYKKAKWQKAKNIVSKVSERNAYANIKTMSAEAVIEVGGNNKEPMKRHLKKNILRLEEKGRNKYYKLHPNFYAIKRYNNSNYYAMALFLLSREL